MQPVVADLEQRCSAKIDFAHIDIDNPINYPTTQRYSVSSIPRYLLLDSSGKVVRQWSGAGSASKFSSLQDYCAAQ